MMQQPTGGDQTPSRSANIEAEIARFKERLKTDPASLAFLPLAEALRKSGKLDEAKVVCLQGLAHHTDYISGQVVLAKILTDMGDRETAREVLERVVEATPDHLLGNKLLAQNYLLSGLKEKARARLGTVVMLNPADEEATIALASLERERRAAPPEPATPVPPPIAEPEVREVAPEPVPSAAPFLSAAPIVSAEAMTEAVPPSPELEELPPTDWSQAAAMDAGDVEEIQIEGEEEEPEGPFLEFGGMSGIDDVEEIADLGGVEPEIEPLEAESFFEAPEPPAASPESETTPVESVLTLPGLSEEPAEHGIEEITSETLADLYLAQDLPDKAIRIYRELLVEEPGNELVAQKLTRAIAAQRGAAGQAAAETRTPASPPVAPTTAPAPAVGHETAGILIARLEEWLTTIGERRRGIH